MLLPPGDNPARMLWDSFPDTVGQWKLNGSRNMTVIHPDGRIELWGRGRNGKPGEIQKQIPLTAPMRQQIMDLKLLPGKLHVLDGEFIHAKTSTVKDVLYQFDILVYNSRHLIGVTGRERYDLLHHIMHRYASAPRYFPSNFEPLAGTMYLAENFPRLEWDGMYQKALTIPFCEGVVVKQMGAASALEYGGQEYNNSGWMTRMRKPDKRYAS